MLWFWLCVKRASTRLLPIRSSTSAIALSHTRRSTSSLEIPLRRRSFSAAPSNRAAVQSSPPCDMEAARPSSTPQINATWSSFSATRSARLRSPSASVNPPASRIASPIFPREAATPSSYPRSSCSLRLRFDSSRRALVIATQKCHITQVDDDSRTAFVVTKLGVEL